MTQATTQTDVATQMTDPTTSAAKPPKTFTAIEAITKISKVLEQLTPADRKRVLAFVNESDPSNE